MKKRILTIIAIGIGTMVLFNGTCNKQLSANDKTRNAQERVVSEGVSQVGVPAIKNFRELKLEKDLYELRDQSGLVTWSYTYSEVTGKRVFLCESIGYPLPYATQFSAPNAMQRWALQSTDDRDAAWGHDILPQPEPNGLFIPASADGTWVMCKNPHGTDVKPLYVEPKVITSQWPLD